MVSAYSICSAVVFYNLSLILVFLLRRKVLFLARYTSSFLLFLTVLGIVRLVTPVDLAPALIITSEAVLPQIQNVLYQEIPGQGIKVCQGLLILWGAGAAVFVLWDILKELKCRLDLRSCTYMEDAQVKRIAAEEGIAWPVRVSPEIAVPCTSGILWPKIYVTYGEYTDEQLRYILRHEAQHIASHDTLVKFLFMAIQALFWWNPIAHFCRKEIDAMLELQCDAKVTDGYDADALLGYMRTITDAARHVAQKTENTRACVMHFAGDSPILKQRFEVLFRRKQRLEKRYRILMASLFFVCFVLSYFVIWQPFYETPSDEVNCYVEITPDNSYILYEDGEYYFCLYGEKIEVLTKDDLSREPYNHLELKGD